MAVTAIDAGDWCSCGVATNDPLHEGWHSLWEWNQQAFALAREKAMKEFEKRLGKKKGR